MVAHTLEEQRQTDSVWCIVIVFITVSLIWSLLNTVFVLHHTKPQYYLDAIPLDLEEASLSGSVTFACDHTPSLLTYRLQYEVNPEDVVTRLHLLAVDPQLNAAMGSPFPIPLCQNAALDSGSLYGGPPCPSDNIVCQSEGEGGCFSIGTLTARGSNHVVTFLDAHLCHRLEATLLSIKMYTEVSPLGAALGNLKQLNSNG